MATHTYTARIRWTGNRGTGNSTYRGYDRTWDIATEGKPVIQCSNDPLLGGDPSLPNPEDLLIASVSSCHMLWYLHLACNAGITVLDYQDDPEAEGEVMSDGAGRFLSATLHPQITLAVGADVAQAEALHDEVHKYCFISRSVNFPIIYAPVFKTA